MQTLVWRKAHSSAFQCVKNGQTVSLSLAAIRAENDTKTGFRRYVMLLLSRLEFAVLPRSQSLARRLDLGGLFVGLQTDWQLQSYVLFAATLAERGSSSSGLRTKGAQSKTKGFHEDVNRASHPLRA